MNPCRCRESAILPYKREEGVLHRICTWESNCKALVSYRYNLSHRRIEYSTGFCIWESSPHFLLIPSLTQEDGVQGFAYGSPVLTFYWYHLSDVRNPGLGCLHNRNPAHIYRTRYTYICSHNIHWLVIQFKTTEKRKSKEYRQVTDVYDVTIPVCDTRRAIHNSQQITETTQTRQHTTEKI